MKEVKLTPVQEANLVSGITLLKRYLSYVDKLEQCGKDCTYTRQRAIETIERAQRTLDEFGSGANPQQ